jgi:hypothetical protein
MQAGLAGFRTRFLEINSANCAPVVGVLCTFRMSRLENAKQQREKCSTLARPSPPHVPEISSCGTFYAVRPPRAAAQSRNRATTPSERSCPNFVP